MNIGGLTLYFTSINYQCSVKPVLFNTKLIIRNDVFFQAFEKGLKALLFASMQEFAFTTHDICKLAAMTGDAILQDKACQVQGIVGVSSRMRYPDMLPSPKIPRDAYSLDDALHAYQSTQSSLRLIYHRIRKLTGVDI